jgi:glycosyltransferase involved in cell wall biosynthesis
MMGRVIEMAAGMGIGNKVLFTGFLRGDDVEKVYQMADLYVMPSVSEPFGIAPLEALNNDVPVLISKQSGVAEVLTHVLKVDFWDIEEMANKMVAVLNYPPLQMTLREHGNFEVRKLQWTDSAKKCAQVYEDAMSKV